MTAAQLKANQANSQHSTGPKTEAGKARSSKNAVQHGILAAVIPQQEPGWDELLLGLYKSFKPQNEAQRTIVDNIAVSTIHLQRVYKAQAAAFSQLEKSPSPETIAALTSYLTLLMRYQNSYNRQIHRSIALLEKLMTGPVRYFQQRESPYLSKDEQPEPQQPGTPFHRKVEDMTEQELRESGLDKIIADLYGMTFQEMELIALEEKDKDPALRPHGFVSQIQVDAYK